MGKQVEQFSLEIGDLLETNKMFLGLVLSIKPVKILWMSFKDGDKFAPYVAQYERGDSFGPNAEIWKAYNIIKRPPRD